MMTEAKEKKPPLLLKKWLLLELALNDKRLAKGDCAVNWQILDRYNPEKGVAYPSMKRLATDTGFTQRNTQRSITKLVNADYVHIIQHGNQSRTNRYRPNFSLLDRVETATSLHDDGVETATSKGRDVEVPNVETAASLEPIYEPAYERGVNEIGKKSNDFFDATPPLPLTGATLASKEQKAKYQFQDFWAIYPKQMNVSKAETEITEALNDGALLDDILDGARRYAVYVKHQGWCGDHQYISQPLNWIKGKRWLDRWEVSPKSKIKTEFEAEAQPAKKTAVKDAPRPAKSKTKAISKTVSKPKYKSGYEPHVIKPINQLTPKEIEAGWGLPEYADFWGVHNKCKVNEYRGCGSGADGLCKSCKEKFDNWQAAKERMKQPHQ